MRFLHTGDWHIGKKLGRIDRSQEFADVLDEILAIARDSKVDTVLVAGDLFDRAAASLESIGVVIDALMRLASEGRTVVAMPGNHDSAQLFEILSPLLKSHRIRFVSRILRPELGGVIKVPSIDGDHAASVGVVPFLHEAQVVDFMKDVEDWYKGYAHRIRLIASAVCSGFDPDCVGILMGHWFVEGAEVGGGERQIHIGQQYAATSHSIPPSASYVALGHIHRPQQIANAAAPSWYSGSILQLDFGEMHDKGVVVVDVEPGLPAKVEFIKLTSGKRLVRVENTIDGLMAMAPDLAGAYVDVRVKTDGPMFGLADQVREFLPGAVMVQAIYDKIESEVAAIEERSIIDAYADYHSSLIGHGVAAPAELMSVLASLEEEVERASA